jgi:dolichyl-diphosphooligosaccharide--protein glycosyltransferase
MGTLYFPLIHVHGCCLGRLFFRHQYYSNLRGIIESLTFKLGLIFIQKFNMKIYVAYSVFYVIGTVLAMQIPFVNFQAIKSSEHMASHGVFFVMNVYVFADWIKKHLPSDQFKEIKRVSFALSFGVFALLFIFLTLKGTTRFSGRSMTLLDPTYAKKYIPIIASVSEH